MNIELVREILNKNHRSIYWLSKQSGIPQNTLYQILSGKHKPQFETVVKIAKTLNITTDSLISQRKKSQKVATYIAYMVELDGVTYYVDTIDMQLTASNFTLTRHYSVNHYDPAYLKRQTSFKVNRLIFGRLSKTFKSVKVFAIRDDDTKEQL